MGVGAGTLASAAGATVISPASGGALTLPRGGSVRSIRLVGSSGLAAFTGLTIQPDIDGSFTYSVSDVIGIGGSSSDIVFGFPGSGLMAASASAGRVVSLAVTRSAFRGGTSVSFFDSAGASLSGAGLTAGMTDTSLIGPSDGGTGLTVFSQAVIDGTGLLSQGLAGAQVADSTVTFRRSRIEGVSGTGTASAGLAVADSVAGTPTTVSVIDSLVSVTPNVAANAVALSATASVGAGTAAVTVRGSTVLARGTDPQYAVVARPAAGAPSTTIALTNTIARLEGPAEADEADVAADRGTVTAAYSDFATRREVNGGTATAPGSATNLTADPLFDAGAFTLQSSSPLIDRGASVVTAGELDLAGNPRAAGLAPDIGAYEFQPPVVPPPPPPSNTAPGLSKVSMTNTVFAPVAARAARARKAVKHGTTFRYVLSEAATVSIVIERQAPGRRAGKRCAKPTHKNAKRRTCTRWLRAGRLSALEQAGRQSTAFAGRIGPRALAAGRYRARIRAKDGAGARSTERRLAFRVVRAR